jgi:hydroxypyruvate isomerase
VLIEPISTGAFAGYHLSTVDQAIGTIEALRADGVPDVVRVILDWFHVADMGDDVLDAATRLGERLGHVQIAAYPDRGEPDAGDLDAEVLLPGLVGAGYEGFFAAEYRPRGDLEAGLTWMAPWLGARADAGSGR